MLAIFTQLRKAALIVGLAVSSLATNCYRYFTHGPRPQPEPASESLARDTARQYMLKAYQDCPNCGHPPLSILRYEWELGTRTNLTAHGGQGRAVQNRGYRGWGFFYHSNPKVAEDVSVEVWVNDDGSIASHVRRNVPVPKEAFHPCVRNSSEVYECGPTLDPRELRR